MLTYIFRGISVMLAVIYTVTSVCVSSVPSGEIITETAVMNNVSNEHEKTTVRILQNRDNISFSLQQAVDLYSKKSVDEIIFSVQTIAFESDYHSALRASLLANDGADLFQISGRREYFELENHIRALEPDDWIMSAYGGTLDAVSLDGRIYGVPYSIEAVGLICSRDVFDAAEILPESIRSLEELDEAFAKIREQITFGESEALIGMEYVTQFAAGDKAFLGTMLADIALSGAFSSAEEAALSGSVDFPAAEQVETFIKIMAKYSGSHPDWTKLAQVADTQQIENFANGRVAVILQDTGAYRRINEINSDMRGRALLLPIPLDIFEQPSIYTGAPSYWSMNAAASDKTATAATSFMEWLYTSDEGSALFASEFGEVSAFRATAKNTGVSLHGQMLSYMSAGMAMPQFNREYPTGWGKNIFAPNIQSYFTEREKTWKEVIEACKQGWSTD